MNESEETIFKAIEDTLENNGMLNKFKAQLRQEVMKVLRSVDAPKKLPKIPEKIVILNELVREYLQWVGYAYTEETLITESGQPRERMHREVIAPKFGIADNDETLQVPLLCVLIEALQNLRENI